MVLIVLCFGVEVSVLVPYVRFGVTGWPPIGRYLLTRLTICFLSIIPGCQFSFSHLVLEWEFLSDCAVS